MKDTHVSHSIKSTVSCHTKKVVFTSSVQQACEINQFNALVEFVANDIALISQPISNSLKSGYGEIRMCKNHFRLKYINVGSHTRLLTVFISTVISTEWMLPLVSMTGISTI